MLAVTSIPSTDSTRSSQWYRTLLGPVDELAPAAGVTEFELRPGTWLQVLGIEGGASRPGMPCASASPTSRPRDRTCWPRAWRPRLSSNSHWRMETGGSASPISTTPTATGCASIRSAPIEIRDRVRRGNSGCGAPCSGESRRRRRRRRQARTAPGWREAPDESETGWRTSSKSSATHAAPRAAGRTGACWRPRPAYTKTWCSTACAQSMGFDASHPPPPLETGAAHPGVQVRISPT